MENKTKMTKGRRKIEIKTIPEKVDRYVTFSKRRNGIYKKASELNTLCGADIGILITSPTGRQFSFGQPNIESIANRFLNQNVVPDNADAGPTESDDHQDQVDQLTRQLTELMNWSEAEKVRGEMLSRMRESRSKNWWEAPPEQLSKEQTEVLRGRLLWIQENLYQRLHQQGGVGPPSSSSSSQPSVAANSNVV